MSKRLAPSCSTNKTRTQNIQSYMGNEKYNTI